jgi:hypothetical protein
VFKHVPRLGQVHAADSDQDKQISYEDTYVHQHCLAEADVAVAVQVMQTVF